MYHRIYKAVAAATVAGSLVLSAGQVWALTGTSGPGGSPAQGSYGAATGCDGGTLVVTRDNETLASRIDRIRVWIEDDSGTRSILAQISIRGSAPDISGSPPNRMDGFFGGALQGTDAATLAARCPNLTNVTVLSSNPFSADEALYATSEFVGITFDATDSNDGNTYLYTAGFEGVTNTGPVFRRELVSTGTPDADATNEGIADATLARARAALANQPNLTPLLADRPEWYFDANAGNDTAFLRFIKGPVWFNLDYLRSTVGMLDNDIIHGVLGSHKQFSTNLIVGSMLQFDIIDSAGSDFTQTSNGFLAGPYFVASNAARTLFVDGSLLYGKSWNEISPTGAYTDDYTSERWLATVKVSGNIERDAFTLRPNVNVKYVSDENESYVDSLGNDIAASDVTIAQAAIGLDAIIPVAVASGSLDLLLGVSGIHSEESFTGASADIRDDLSQSRGRIDLGFEWQGEAGSVFTASMFYDGLGADDFEAQGLSLAYHITF